MVVVNDRDVMTKVILPSTVCKSYIYSSWFMHGSSNPKNLGLSEIGSRSQCLNGRDVMSHAVMGAVAADATEVEQAVGSCKSLGSGDTR